MKIQHADILYRFATFKVSAQHKSEKSTSIKYVYVFCGLCWLFTLAKAKHCDKAPNRNNGGSKYDGQRQACYQFTGYAVQTPAFSTCTLLLFNKNFIHYSTGVSLWGTVRFEYIMSSNRKQKFQLSKSY